MQNYKLVETYKIKQRNNSNVKQPTSVSHNLDTLAQLDQNTHNSLSANIISDTKKKYQYRAKAKAITNSYLFDLIDLKSPMLKAYWQTYHCSNVLLQDNNVVKSRYCNQRWCGVCNRIRTAKIINGYKPSIDRFIEPYFVTLTVPNCTKKDLPKVIDKMTKDIRNVNRRLKTTHKLKVKALRKYECTYNGQSNTYHPHFHFIVESEKLATAMKNEWLKINKKASHVAQDVRQATDTSLIELCKYFTKIIAKGNDYNPKALDTMFRAVKGKRTYQPSGIVKHVSEDIEPQEAQEIDFKESKQEIYTYQKDVYDWVSGSGELFSEYTPTIQDLRVIEFNKVPQDENRNTT